MNKVLTAKKCIYGTSGRSTYNVDVHDTPEIIFGIITGLCFLLFLKMR